MRTCFSWEKMMWEDGRNYEIGKVLTGRTRSGTAWQAGEEGSRSVHFLAVGRASETENNDNSSWKKEKNKQQQHTTTAEGKWREFIDPAQTPPPNYRNFRARSAGWHVAKGLFRTETALFSLTPPTFHRKEDWRLEIGLRFQRKEEMGLFRTDLHFRNNRLWNLPSDAKCAEAG